MRDQKFAKAVKKAIAETLKRPADEQFRNLIEAGIIDEQGRVFSENRAMVEELLHKKGFGGISVFHRGRVPGGAVRLHEKIAPGRQAEGPYDKFFAIIKKARDPEDLWKFLENAGYCSTRARALGKKENRTKEPDRRWK